MKLALFLGAAVTAVTLAAASAETTSRVVVRHGGGPDINLDANNDGWLTRAEATAAADRMFEHMDVNHDGRLTPEDRQAMHEMHVRVDGPDVHIEDDGHGERHVRVIRRGDSDIDDAEIEAEIERAMAEAHRGVAQAEREAHRAERHARQTERDARDAERRTERQVVIIRGDEDEDADLPGMPPMPPMPPHPPMFMMLVDNSDEADTNGDGALSREEFRAQQLRFFDASDANGDGRIRLRPRPNRRNRPNPGAPAPPRR